MNDERETRNYSRQLKLPSGRHIQVVYYERGEPCDDPDLGLCGTCGCTLVQPLCAEPIGKLHWQLSLRCPNCLWVGTGVFSEQSVERLEQARGRDVALIRRELEQISLANMVQDTERFVRALHGDLILPSDF